MTQHVRTIPVIAILLAALRPFAYPASDFAFKEPVVSTSPDSAVRIAIPAGESVLDLDVSPLRAEAMVLTETRDGRGIIRIWRVNGDSAGKILDVPEGFKAKSLAWHPLKRSFFLLGRRGNASVILSVEDKKGSWATRSIFETPETLRRLVVGPRPFITGNDQDSGEYRLFFGRKDPSGGFSIRTITENGRKPYQVIGKKDGLAKETEDAPPPSDLVSASALPIGFHPAGHLLLWENAKSCFEIADYGSLWIKSVPVLEGKICGGTVTATPNGLALLHWQSGREGLEALMLNGARRTRQGMGYTFAFTPSSVPDGKGVVGVIREGDRQFLAYVPMDIPLADVVNAWMFVESEDDLARYTRTGGVLRKTAFEQMYNLYDTENYYCGGYDRTAPARPYFVTTDAFWEVFAAAFEGLFVVAEKHSAIPAFWEFVGDAAAHYTKRAPGSYWSKVFSALDDMRRGSPGKDGEAKRIAEAQGTIASTVLGGKVDFGRLKPRGHYASSPEFQAYFKAFTYLTRLASEGKAPLKELEQAPPALKQKAMAWMNPYGIFIAGSRSPLAWSPSLFKQPAYNKYPEMLPKVFPLSWAMDNEILNSTVLHESWPGDEQIIGPQGGRMMASAMDIPATYGNPLALTQSKSEFERYPNLNTVMQDLQKRPRPGDGNGANLYDRWLNALTVQWSASPAAPGKREDWGAWDAKRLQTGLASWATLRHTTVLVNESSGAECGEGGYEEIVLRPPRGYVEPDPATFSAIAGLFDAAASKLRALPLTSGNRIADDSIGTEALQKGLLNRLKESAQDARLFAAMAQKELRGQTLEDAEYESIHTIGRVVEHHFLVYKSLSTKGLGLATPEPIAKIADVAHGPGGKPYLFAAVGQPMEWNQVVPFFGRRQLVKGAVYSFYEFQSDSLFNDKEWQARLSTQNRPAWIKPLVTDKGLSCPPQKPF
jgi:hypothetical protein